MFTQIKFGMKHNREKFKELINRSELVKRSDSADNPTWEFL